MPKSNGSCCGKLELAALFFILLTLCGSLHAEEIAYDSGKRRDPFVPLTGEDASMSASSSGVKLEGIIYDPGYLFFVQKKLPRPHRIRICNIAEGVGGYVHILQKDLRSFHPGKTITEASLGRPKALNLGAGKGDPCLETFEYGIFEPSMPVGSDYYICHLQPLI